MVLPRLFFFFFLFIIKKKGGGGGGGGELILLPTLCKLNVNVIPLNSAVTKKTSLCLFRAGYSNDDSGIKAVTEFQKFC